MLTFSGSWWQVKKGTNDRPILEFVHGLFHDLGVQDLTVQTDDAWDYLNTFIYANSYY